MMVTVRLSPGDKVMVYDGRDGDTYEDALLSVGINPDIVLIFCKGVSLPQDKVIKEPEVEIVSTCSRG